MHIWFIKFLILWLTTDLTFFIFKHNVNLVQKRKIYDYFWWSRSFLDREVALSKSITH